MINYTNSHLVKQFRETGGNIIPDTLILPTFETALKRSGFVISELNEYLAAIEQGNALEAIDGLIDAIYFCEDGLLEMGCTPEFISDFFNEVHEANMSKFCKTELEALESISAYLAGTHPQNGNNEHYNPHYRKVGEFWAVYCHDTNKTLKSINTRKPDLYTIVAKHYAR